MALKSSPTPNLTRWASLHEPPPYPYTWTTDRGAGFFRVSHTHVALAPYPSDPLVGPSCCCRRVDTKLTRPLEFQ